MIPILKSLVLCDSVVMDQFTGKWSLHGVINAALIPSVFPARCPKFSAYVSVGDVSGECVGKVRVLDPELRQVAESVSAAIRFSPGETLDFGAVFPGVRLECPGEYQIEAVVNDQVIGTTKFTILTQQ